MFSLNFPLKNDSLFISEQLTLVFIKNGQQQKQRFLPFATPAYGGNLVIVLNKEKVSHLYHPASRAPRTHTNSHHPTSKCFQTLKRLSFEKSFPLRDCNRTFGLQQKSKILFIDGGRPLGPANKRVCIL